MPIEVTYPGVYVQESPSTPAAKALTDAVFGDREAAAPTLDVIRVDPGHEEPEGEDFVTITQRPDGGFEFGGTVRIPAAEHVAASAVTVSGIVHRDGPLPTPEAAEAIAVRWAAELGAKTLYVLSDVEEPLRDTAIVQNTGYRVG